MGARPFNTVAGVVFGLVAIAHAVRVALGIPVLVGETAVPMWVSWLGVLVPGLLCVWAFRPGT